MMRNGTAYGLGAKLKSEIVGERRLWSSFLSERIRTTRFLRGFPVLVETLINGIKTLNRSAELQGQDDGKPMEGWHLAVTLIVSIAFALLLSLVLPHGLTWLLTVAGISGDVSGVSFQLDEARIPVFTTFGNVAYAGRPIELVVDGSRVRYSDVQSLELRLNIPVTAHVCDVATPPYGEILLCTCAYRNYCEKRHHQ